MSTNAHTSALSVCLILILYLLQGLNLGLTACMPFFLATRGATWKDQGTFNFAYYPFSFKLLWAPLIDAVYSSRFGRRKSWLVPIQLTMVGILFFLSFYVQSFIDAGHATLLAIVFFGIMFLTATQDICVDGLAISLFTATNSQWTSTSQTVGQTMGRFIGSPFLLTLESANFTNRFIREPLSLPLQSSGLFSLEQFIRFAAVSFLVVTTCLSIFFREQKMIKSMGGEETISFSLSETYISIWKLFQKKCIRHLTLVALISPIGLVAINYMTRVALISQGVPQATLALVEIPVTLVSITAPLVIRNTKQPLTWFSRSYVLYLISGLPIAAYVYFTPHIIYSNYYYLFLVLLLTCNEFIRVLRFTAQVGFFASISEPRIGGTYMTLLATLHNLGFSINSSLVLYAASLLPKQYAYIIAVISCTIFGVIWLVFSFRTLKRLENQPITEWYLKPETIKDDTATSVEQGENDHDILLIQNKEMNQIT